ncbi:MAG: hypothetical protein HN380_00005, partial [Victivallales bacterium]|nr:hypothetical protein [Victivallales bacterium]
WKDIKVLAMALEALGDARATEVIASYLKKPGAAGNAIQDALTSTRLRGKNGISELVLARVLYNLGDHEGLGEKSLKAFSEDVRGHYRRHALAVLAQGPGIALRK